MPAPLSQALIHHLQRCGYKSVDLENWSGETRLFQDIGLYGDNAADDLELLRREFAIDFEGFPFSKYFPNDFSFSWQTFVLNFFWRSRWAEEVRGRYPPLTLEMLDVAIREKKWPFDR
jgi:hypothetical protein